MKRYNAIPERLAAGFLIFGFSITAALNANAATNLVIDTETKLIASDARPDLFSGETSLWTPR